jgi:hypothetical protein
MSSLQQALIFLMQLIPALEIIGMSANADACINQIDNQVCLLAMIRNFQSAGTASSQAHLPVFRLTDPVLRTITNSTHAIPMVQAAGLVFTQFEAMLRNFPQSVPPAQRVRIAQLQDAVRTLWRYRFPLRDTPDEILHIAQQLATIPLQ